MSHENVEIVSAAISAIARGDTEGFVALLTPDVVMVGAREYPGAGTSHGPAEVLGTLEDWGDSWSQMRFDVENFKAAGDRVLAVGRAHQEGGLSGLEFDNAMAIVFTVRDKMIARAEFFLDVDEAKALAGVT